MNRPEIFNAILDLTNGTKYLEIGVDDPDNTFNHVKAKKKVGVDPYNDKTGCHAWNPANKETLIQGIDGEFVNKTSDEFFADLDKRTKFDLVFIDGMHTKEQVLKDIDNALNHLSKKGIIVVDDTYPMNIYETKTPPDVGQPWRGTVYEAIFYIRRERQDIFVASNEMANMSFIKKGKMERYEDHEWGEDLQISYEYFSVYKYLINNEVSIDIILNEIV